MGKPEKKNKKKKYEFSEEDDELNEHFEDINLTQDVNKPDEASALANGGNEEDERDQK